ncbi:MAG: dephospho-CoA kinase [Proteobacteria bacterium]|nr:dephospho-CoA kinase [Pseudomonadota bacterium]
MWIIGLTGSIGMGKSTAGQILKGLKVPVHDSDSAVHRAFMQGGAAVAAIDNLFPGVVENETVNRQALGKIVFNDDAAIKALEEILHPLVRQDRNRFIAHWRQQRRFAVAMDVPLLFETGTDRECDLTIVVTAPAFIQKKRVLRRPGMSPERFAAIKARQMPDWEKRRRADFVVPTNFGRRVTFNCLTRIVLMLREKSKV